MCGGLFAVRVCCGVSVCGCVCVCVCVCMSLFIVWGCGCIVCSVRVVCV